MNVEMHKQTEICKRLDAIIRQVLPFLSGEVRPKSSYLATPLPNVGNVFIIKQPPPFLPIFTTLILINCFQHQQQVAVAVERAKQITMAELNAVMQVGFHCKRIG